jgi:predicted ATPase
VRQAYERALTLCPQTPDATQFAIRWGLWLFHKVRSELDRARDMAEGLLELSRHLTDPSLVMQTQQALAVTTLCRGEPAATVRHMEQSALLYDPRRHHTHSSQFGQDPGVACKAFGAVALWLLGFPNEAERQSNAALELAEDLVQPSSQALALHFAAMLYQLRREPARTLACAEKAHAIAEEQGFSFWLAGGKILRGWALAFNGQPDQGIQSLRQGLLDWQATGSVTYRTYYLGLLAEVLASQGQAVEGRRVLEEALALARQTNEGLFEAELHRLGGELLLAGVGEPDVENVNQAEACCQQALATARRQEARSLELRALMSLIRLPRRSSDDGEAKTLLAETRGWFTEGLETPDLREASALLQ